MTLSAAANGVFAIAPTPFHDDGRIDEASIDRLTDFYGEVGCDGVTVLGILGEAPKLDAAEAELVGHEAVDRHVLVRPTASGHPRPPASRLSGRARAACSCRARRAGPRGG